MSTTLTDALAGATSANNDYLDKAEAVAALIAAGSPEPQTTEATNAWQASRAVLLLTKGDVDSNYPVDLPLAPPKPKPK